VYEVTFPVQQSSYGLRQTAEDLRDKEIDCEAKEMLNPSLSSL